MRLLLVAALLVAPGIAGAQSRLQARLDSMEAAARATPGTLFEFEAQRPVRPLGPQPALRYPEALRAAGVEGRVMARFEVDTVGLVDTATFRVVGEAEPAFVQAVREILAALRYRPAENKGRRVRQVVVQRFEFALTR